MRTRSRAAVLVALTATGCALALTVAPAEAGPTASSRHVTESAVASAPADTVAWAPADTAALHPGVQTYTGGAQCTSNFVFTDDAGNVYLGQAAHCAGTGAATETNGCDSGSLPLGTRVTFNEGGSLISDGTQLGTGRLAYSSWLTMRQRNETHRATCRYNDLALVKVNAAYVDDVNPSIPFWGGPAGIATTGTEVGDRVYTYGNSSLRAGVTVLSPHTGVSVGTVPSGWSHALYTVTPGVPGDSGSAFLDKDGKALGTLSTIAIAPLAGSNNIGDLSRALGYAQRYSGISGVRMVPGTVPFDPLL